MKVYEGYDFTVWRWFEGVDTLFTIADSVGHGLCDSPDEVYGANPVESRQLRQLTDALQDVPTESPDGAIKDQVDRIVRAVFPDLAT